jgi:hypothetical protein
MPLTLSNIPGFADLPDSVLAAERNVISAHLRHVSDNAAFGVVRLEVFTGLYHHGDTVILPTSPVDGYNYVRSELLYLWTPVNTGNAATQWATDGPPWTMWYGAWLVDQTSGKVSCTVGYRGNQDHTDRQASTNDTTLQVWTIAQRGLTTLTMAHNPYYVDHVDTEFVQDAPVRQGLVTDMNNSAKMSTAATEVIYMGEFVHGDSVGHPISPIDGYVYDYAEVIFQTSPRWTANGGSVMTIPPLSQGQLDDWSFQASSAGVTCQVEYESNGRHSYNLGRVAVFAFCQRGHVRVTVPGTAQPWNTTTANTANYPNFVPNGTTAIVVPMPLVAGDSIQLSASVLTIGIPPNDADPLGHSYLSSYPGGFPVQYVAGATIAGPIRYMGLMGAFTDAAGNVVQPIAIGNGGTFTCPVGATQLLLGINDSLLSDNSGSLRVVVTKQAAAPAPSFVELDISTFNPGSTLRASTLNRVQKNIRAAMLTPEFFVGTYANGATIPVPTSPVDGYTYARSELQYIFDWHTTGPGAFTSSRAVLFSASVDSSGVVHLSDYRFPSGASNWDLEHNGTIRVVVFGKRQLTQELAVPADTQPVGGTVSDQADGAILINGV